MTKLISRAKKVFSKLKIVLLHVSATRESRMRKSLEVTIRSDEKMTTESDSNGKEMTKGLRNSGIVKRIWLFNLHL
jgi:hypothetical protein